MSQLLTESASREIDHQIATITSQWGEVCDRAGLTQVDRAAFMGRQYLNPYATEGY